HHARLQRRMALALVPRRAAQRDAVIERRVVADLGRLADDDPHAVVDEDPPADRRARMDLDSGPKTAPVRQPACEPAQAARPQRVSDRTVPDQRVDARVAGEHFPTGAGRGVAVEHHGDVFAQMVEHGRDSGISESFTQLLPSGRAGIVASMRRPIRTSLLAVAWLAAGIGVAAGEPTARATSPAPANPAAPVTTSPPVMPPAAATPAVPDARPSPPSPVTIRRPVAAKPCVSATRKLEREQSSLETAEADV